MLQLQNAKQEAFLYSLKLGHKHKFVGTLLWYEISR